MKFACQVILTVLFASGFLITLYFEINGRPATKPHGFTGVMRTFAIYGVVAALYWQAGIFEAWLR